MRVALRFLAPLWFVIDSRAAANAAQSHDEGNDVALDRPHQRQLPLIMVPAFGGSSGEYETDIMNDITDTACGYYSWPSNDYCDQILGDSYGSCASDSMCVWNATATTQKCFSCNFFVTCQILTLDFVIDCDWDRCKFDATSGLCVRKECSDKDSEECGQDETCSWFNGVCDVDCRYFDQDADDCHAHPRCFYNEGKNKCSFCAWRVTKNGNTAGDCKEGCFEHTDGKCYRNGVQP